MTEELFLERRASLQKEIADHKLIIDKKYTELVKSFLTTFSPVKLKSVYEISDKGACKVPRGCKRFVVYSEEARVVYEESIWITVGGWWLDKDNKPFKWTTETVYGIGNPTVFKLSEDQTNLPHPESKIYKQH